MSLLPRPEPDTTPGTARRATTTSTAQRIPLGSDAPTRWLVGWRGSGASRRDGYYATGERESNLATLVRICAVLAATPNDMLLSEDKAPVQSGRDRLLARITAAADSVSPAELDLAACLIECVSAHRRPRLVPSRRTGTKAD